MLLIKSYSPIKILENIIPTQFVVKRKTRLSNDDFKAQITKRIILGLANKILERYGT